MPAFMGRIAVLPGGVPTLVESALPVAEALRRLEAGEAAAEVFGAAPLDLAAALAFATLGDEASPGPSLIRRAPERPRLVAAVSEAALAGVAPRAPRPARLALAAGLLQVLDAWEASHEAAQEADDLGERRFSAYWHGIAHRREPDAVNASYWFRRVGPHDVFPSLARAAAPMGEGGGTGPVGPNGWDPYAMIELCTRALAGTNQERLARRLQRLEMAMLLEATAGAIA